MIMRGSLGLVLCTSLCAQSPHPVWVLSRDAADRTKSAGTFEMADGVVKVDGTNTFALPDGVLGAQKDYTIEFEVRRPADAKPGSGIILFSNSDESAKAGVKLVYYPPEYNACWLFCNSYQTLEQRGFLSDGFNAVTLVAKDGRLALFRNGLVLAVTDEVKPSALPLTFGGAATAGRPPPAYALRNLKVYAEAVFPKGFDPSVERMRNVSGDQYFMQRAEVKDRSLPRILVVGDSISMGYRSFIADHFKGRAYVDYWVGGAWFGDTARGANAPIKRGWSGVLANGPYDVVSWNAMTLHMWSPRMPERCSFDTFPANLTEVVEHLKKVAPKTAFIWVRCTPCTTPVEGKPSVIDMKQTERLIRFNELTDAVMKKYGIPEVDLYALCERNLDQASKDGVHWSREASALMAQEVVREIEKGLAQKR